ncbi:MAG: rhomboid family intramembrane serine protease [Acidiferrobacterales bacterium]
MFFFPYRPDIGLYKIPLFSILVVAVCLAVYTAQYQNERDIYRSAIAFCEAPYEAGFQRALVQLSGRADVDVCLATLLEIHLVHDKDALIDVMAYSIGATPGVVNGGLRDYYAAALRDTYGEFKAQVPEYFTAQLWYAPESWDVGRMFTATVSHGSWLHLIANLIFFFAFAASVEIIVGPLLYLFILSVLALGTHTVYSLVLLGQPDAFPTLGLSGVVMGTLALFSFFAPAANIRCFVWLVVFFRTISIPAWILAAWFIGWDVYAQVSGVGNAGINLIAHLSGAAIGLAIGIVFFRAKKHWAKRLMRSEHAARISRAWR